MSFLRNCPVLAGDLCGRAKAGKGFWAYLFDLSFQHLITPRITKAVFTIGTILSGLIALIGLLISIAALGDVRGFGHAHRSPVNVPAQYHLSPCLPGVSHNPV